MFFYRLIGSFAGVSMIGSFLIMVTFLMVKEVRKHPTTLVFWMSVCDFFFSLKFLASSLAHNSTDLPSNKPICLLQGISGQFFGLASIGWIGMISLNLVFNLRNPFANTAKYAPWYHIWVWGYSILTTALIVAKDDIGNSGDGTCWIRQEDTSGKTNLMVLTFLIPLIVYFVIAIVALVYASARSQDSFEGQSKMARSIIFRMRVFVTVFIVLWTGVIVHRITQVWWTGSNDPKWLQYWEGVSASTQGFFNSLIWLSHPVVFKSFKNLMQRLGCCWTQTAEFVPLLGKLESELEEQEDIQRMDVLMRKSIITCILLGVKKAIIARGDSEVNYYEDYREVYSTKKSDDDEKDMLKQGLSVGTVRELEKVRLRYLFKDYEPVIFEKLRQRDAISNQVYLEALHPESFLGNIKNQAFSEGRSGSFFCFSPDKSFIIKTIESHEADVLMSLISDFHRHLEKYPHSLLNRLYGFHSVKIHQLKIFVIVMGNVMNTNLRIHERYDLKFSWVQRNNKAHKDDPSVLGKDSNLKRKLKLTQQQRQELLSQIEADAKFLSTHGIMDYSLLVAFHFNDKQPSKDVLISINSLANETTPSSSASKKILENRGMLSGDGTETYFIGMIDILQAYNFDKKMERFMKVHLLKKDKLGLSVQPVDVYYERFVSRPQLIMEVIN